MGDGEIGRKVLESLARSKLTTELRLGGGSSAGSRMVAISDSEEGELGRGTVLRCTGSGEKQRGGDLAFLRLVPGLIGRLPSAGGNGGLSLTPCAISTVTPPLFILF